MSDKRITNKEYVKSDIFIAYCKRAGVEPTPRQASKFRREVGKAWKSREVKKVEAA